MVVNNCFCLTKTKRKYEIQIVFVVFSIVYTTILINIEIYPYTHIFKYTKNIEFSDLCISNIILSYIAQSRDESINILVTIVSTTKLIALNNNTVQENITTMTTSVQDYFHRI